MSKKEDKKEKEAHASEISKEDYEDTLYKLQVELVKLQRHLIECGDKILIIMEGRDASGKDGTIKRITEHLSPRETRVVALGKPSDRDRNTWYFQRYVQYLPAAQELVLFNRSWYNRAGVEKVMGFCTDAEYEEFMGSVVEFELMLIRSGIKLLKYYLDISKPEQEKRLSQRRKDPLAQWKISALDGYALEKWDEYTLARDKMLTYTHNLITPWIIVHADDKQLTRLNVIKDMLSRLDYEDKDEHLILPDPQIVSIFTASFIEEGLLAV
ncbi:polyphosphate kinase 2, PA0141 family [Nitrosospira multiformis]|uniref:ADP/GDP-polyphosphate phosphotransferase n=1 Tax=Nitrosospira multiformis TaxID=1231 RepID=A0A1I0D3H6_9PROT|nr:polyphosphate kinase 2 [Nitrosospira multiformis]SET26018.1 polyphosphate kinase 2, PA0141 family [Nitrosospira multiformis]